MHIAVRVSGKAKPLADTGKDPDKERLTSNVPLTSEEFRIHVSPVITAFALLATFNAGAVWPVPPQREAPELAVMLSNSTYQKLVLWRKQHCGAESKSVTIVQVIEHLANITEREHGASGHTRMCGS